MAAAATSAQSPPRVSVDGRGPAKIGMTESELSTSGGAVARFYAGTADAIQFVEGCL